MKIKKSLSQVLKTISYVWLFVGTRIAMAAGGSGASQTVDNFFTEVLDIIKTPAATVATIGILICGYMIASGRRAIETLMPWIIGCLLLGCGPWIVSLFNL